MIVEMIKNKNINSWYSALIAATSFRVNSWLLGTKDSSIFPVSLVLPELR